MKFNSLCSKLSFLFCLLYSVGTNVTWITEKVVFLVDESSSVLSDEIFEQEKAYMREVVIRMPVMTQYSIITYSDVATVIHQFSGIQGTLNAISNLQWPGVDLSAARLTHLADATTGDDPVPYLEELRNNNYPIYGVAIDSSDVDWEAFKNITGSYSHTVNLGDDPNYLVQLLQEGTTTTSPLLLSFVCPPGYQAFHTFTGGVPFSPTCVQFENPDCVQECYWASASFNQTQGDCSYFYDTQVVHNDIYFTWKKAVYVAGYRFNGDSINMACCCISRGSIVGTCASDVSYGSGNGSVFDISSRYPTTNNPITRSVNVKYHTDALYYYSVEVCNTSYASVNMKSQCQPEPTTTLPTTSTTEKPAIDCMRFVTCETCSKTEKCGWCDASSSCMAGDAIDATNVKCTTWFYRNCLTADDSTTCSNQINKTNCIQTLCDNPATPRELFACQKCQDLHHCFRDNDETCRTWDEEKCPGGYLNPNVSEPQRMEQILVQPEVQVIDEKKIILYVCNIAQANEQTTIAVEDPAANYTAGTVLSSFQSGVILHKVIDTTKRGGWTFATARPAELTEVFENAEFSYQVTDEDTRSRFMEDDTPSDLVVARLRQINGTVLNSYDVSGVHHLYRLIGQTVLDSNQVTQNYSVLAVPKTHAPSLQADDVIFSNDSAGYLEVVDAAQALSAAETLLKTHLAQFETGVTYDIATLLPSEIKSFSCVGGDMSQSINVFASGIEQNWMAPGKTIVGRKSGAVALHVSAVYDGGDFMLYEGYPLVSVSEDGVVTPSFLPYKPQKRDILMAPLTAFGFSFKPPCKYLIEAFCHESCKNVECEFDFSLKPSLKILGGLTVITNFQRSWWDLLLPWYIAILPKFEITGGIGAQIILEVSAKIKVAFTPAKTYTISRTLFGPKTKNFYVNLGVVVIPGTVQIELKHEVTVTLQSPLKIGFDASANVVKVLNIGVGDVDFPSAEESVRGSFKRIFEPFGSSAQIQVQYDIGPFVTVTWPNIEIVKHKDLPSWLQYVLEKSKFDIYAMGGAGLRGVLTAELCACCAANRDNPHSFKVEAGPFATFEIGVHLFGYDPKLYTTTAYKALFALPENGVCFSLPVLDDDFCNDKYLKCIDECASNPCMNGACLDLRGSFFCACDLGYTGDRCETEIDECTSSPCLNGGTCQDLLAAFSCSCDKHFTGNTCETDITTINECASQPCQNWGECVDHIGSFSCSCVEGYVGDRCETTRDDSGVTKPASGENGNFPYTDEYFFVDGNQFEDNWLFVPEQVQFDSKQEKCFYMDTPYPVALGFGGAYNDWDCFSQYNGIVCEFLLGNTWIKGKYGNKTVVTVAETYAEFELVKQKGRCPGAGVPPPFFPESRPYPYAPKPSSISEAVNRKDEHYQMPRLDREIKEIKADPETVEVNKSQVEVLTIQEAELPSPPATALDNVSLPSIGVIKAFPTLQTAKVILIYHADLPEVELNWDTKYEGSTMRCAKAFHRTNGVFRIGDTIWVDAVTEVPVGIIPIYYCS